MYPSGMAPMSIRNNLHSPAMSAVSTHSAVAVPTSPMSLTSEHEQSFSPASGKKNFRKGLRKCKCYRLFNMKLFRFLEFSSLFLYTRILHRQQMVKENNFSIFWSGSMSFQFLKFSQFTRTVIVVIESLPKNSLSRWLK